jgi:hypothetical protein
MAAVATLLSYLQVTGGSGVQHAASPDPLGCLGLLLALVLVSAISFSALKIRSALNPSSKDKPDFTSLRSTGKTIVNAHPDEDDPDKFGGVN